jgi:hypothetical protein
MRQWQRQPAAALLLTDVDAALAKVNSSSDACSDMPLSELLGG